MHDHVRDFWAAQDSKKVRKYLRQAAAYDNARPAEDARFLNEWVARRYAGKTVLDFGAGPGRLVGMWSDHEVKLTAAEFSGQFLPILRQRCDERGQECCELDIAKGRLDRKFDLVFATQVLLHIHPREIRAALENAKAMTKRDVLFINGGLGPPFHGDDTDKTSSFFHDYDSLFAEVGLNLELDMTLLFRWDGNGKPRKTPRLNRVMFLAAAD